MRKVVNMKKEQKTVNQRLEKIALEQLGIASFHKSMMHERNNFSIHQIEKAMKLAYFLGERLGYKVGYQDASGTRCDCVDKIS